MNVRTVSRSISRTLGLAVLGIGVITVLVRPTGAIAGTAVCRTDPVITLSNGKVVTLAASISDTAADVRNVAYVLHAPSGTTVVSVSYSGDIPGSQETFTFYADRPAGTYEGFTTVTTGVARIPVTATETVGTTQSLPASGTSGTAVKTQVSIP